MNADRLAQMLAAGEKSCWLGMYTDETGVSFLLEVSCRTLQRWRSSGKGPPWEFTSKVRYDLEKLALWLDAGGEKKCLASRRQPPPLTDNARQTTLASASAGAECSGAPSTNEGQQR